MIKSERSKNECRKRYLVVEVLREKRAVIVQKFLQSQIRNKKYKVKIEEIILVEKNVANSESSNDDQSDVSQLIYQNKEDDAVLPTNNHEIEDVTADETDQEDDHSTRTREKPRIDYSILHRTGEKVLIGNVKIDYANICDYCHSRSFSNYYHSKKICERLKLLEKSEDETIEEEQTVFMDDKQIQSVPDVVLPGSPKDCNFLFSPGSTKTAIIEDETLLSQLEENVQVPMNTNSEYLVEAVCKIQKWWREKLRSKIQEAWDKSLDPPNWNSHFPSPLPVSFSEPYSPSEFEHALITLGKMYPSHKFF